MSKSAQTKLISSQSINHPNIYVQAMYNEYTQWVLDEQACQNLKDKWTEKIFQSNTSSTLNIEIGTGTGEHLAWRAKNSSNQAFLGIELKYKPLIQTARRIKKNACFNARVIRYNARLIQSLFAKNEINNVYIHFPDPWPKTKHCKHRLIKSDFINALYMLQKEEGFVEIKTDDQNYFLEIHSLFKNSPYQLSTCSHNLHQNFTLNKDNFITGFEKIFLKQNQAIYYLKYSKSS